jgi:hypothetical protein
VLAFHAIKAAGLFFDQQAFRKASLIGEMAMNKRPWLLHYARYLPPALRVASREPDPEAWLSRMPPGPVIDAARAVLATERGCLARMQPRTRAGVAVVVAWKRHGLPRFDGATVAEMFARAGLSYSSSYNAAVRVGLIAGRVRIHGCTVAATLA